MHINLDGSITTDPPIPLFTPRLAQPVFNQVKDISSIFLDNSVKTDEGYLFTQETLTATIRKLTLYLKQIS